MSGFSSRLGRALAERREQGLYRQRRTLASAQGPEVILAGQTCLNFCSNDYLGLAADPRLVTSFQRAAGKYGVGSGASHLVCGHSEPHRALEEALADFTGRPRALLFSSGYAANTAVLGTLLQQGDFVFEDRLNHASLLDGGLHSGARFQRYLHNDVDSLRARMARLTATAWWRLTGCSAWTATGRRWRSWRTSATRPDAWLMVDDAHGFGVLGERGAGSLELAGLAPERVPVLMVTLGKALGAAGACVIGDELLIDSLVQQARNYIYTTATPPAVAAAALTGLQLVRRSRGDGSTWRT